MGDFKGAWDAAPPPYSEVGQGPKGAPPADPRQEVILACGGWDGDIPLSSAELFDPSKGAWSPLPPMPEPRRDHGAAVLGDSLYCVGGWNLDPYYRSVVRLDLRSMAWFPAPPLSSPRGWPGCAVLNGQLYCAGGYDERDKALTLVERFSPQTNGWERVASLDQKRGGCGLVALNDCLYAIGGYDGDKPLKSVERFDPRENKWRKVASLSQGRREDLSHACVVYNGSILLMGGQGEGEQNLFCCLSGEDVPKVMDSGEIYNSATDSWTPTPTKLTRGKRGLSLAVVGGVVFGVGGEDREDQNLQTVMMLDQASGAWVEWHPMRARRAGHAVGVVRKEQLGGGGEMQGGGGGFTFPAPPPPYSQ